MDMEDFQEYVQAIEEIHRCELKALEEFQLAERVELYVNTLKTIEIAEAKYSETQKELKSLKKHGGNGGGGESSVLSSKKYNQLLVKYNLALGENKNLEKSYNQLSTKYNKLAEKHKSDRFHLPPAPIRSASFRSMSHRSMSQRSSRSSISPSRMTTSPTRRSPLRQNIFGDAESTTISQQDLQLAQSTPGRKSVLSPTKSLNILNSPSGSVSNPSLSEMSQSALQSAKGSPSKSEANATFTTPQGSQKVLLRRTRPLTEDTDVSPGGKRSRGDDENAFEQERQKLSRIQVLHGGGKSTPQLQPPISPLKSRNRFLRRAIDKKKMN